MDNMVKLFKISQEVMTLSKIEVTALICTLIDMMCAKYGDDPVKTAEDIANSVKEVNNVFGAYDA